VFIGEKAQMEIMGLVLIVILIAIAMLFTLQFVILKQPTAIKKTYTRSTLTNMVDAILNTNTECREINFRSLLQDCASSFEGSRINCFGSDSCEYVEDELNKIFDNTLRKWNIAFVIQCYFSRCQYQRRNMHRRKTK